MVALGAIVVALLIPGAAFAAETDQTGEACTGHWPASVQGTPKTYKSGGRAGNYLWHDAKGWHLRVTKVSSAKAIFSGVIRSDKPLSVKGVRLEKGDRFTLSADKLSITYRFANYGHIDGLDFRTACAERISVRGSMNGDKLPIGRIWIGRAGHHPLQNPFVIRRVH
jgi:hypothetical protein